MKIVLGLTKLIRREPPYIMPARTKAREGKQAQSNASYWSLLVRFDLFSQLSLLSKLKFESMQCDTVLLVQSCAPPPSRDSKPSRDCVSVRLVLLVHSFLVLSSVLLVTSTCAPNCSSPLCVASIYSHPRMHSGSCNGCFRQPGTLVFFNRWAMNA